jgi:hypothetical protein
VLIWFARCRTGPTPREDRVELGLADQERVVLDLDFLVGLEEVERHLVRGLHTEKRPERHRWTEAEYLREEFGRGALVVGVNDRVVELDGHSDVPLSVMIFSSFWTRGSGSDPESPRR